MKQIDKAVQALACAIGFWRPSLILLKKMENAKENHQANSPGPVCILQIFGNNPSRGFRVRAETSGGGMYRLLCIIYDLNYLFCI